MYCYKKLHSLVILNVAVFLVVALFYARSIEPTLFTSFKKEPVLENHLFGTQQRFAVFSCATPSKNGHRGFDYAFYLPLTTLAWQRIGFQSIILIIGNRQDWLNRPELSYVLQSLYELKANVLFIVAKPENWMSLSQTARLFAANMNIGKETDYLITSDADLWPLCRNHFVPRINKTLILVHSDCCGNFQFKNSTFRMIPMSHIGANIATWKEIIKSQANDSISILAYFQHFFGPRDMDQKLISILVDRWISTGSNLDLVHEVSDSDMERIDRSFWFVETINPRFLSKFYDAHLILKAPENWKRIRPLIYLMYGRSWQSNWVEKYAKTFLQLYVPFQRQN